MSIYVFRDAVYVRAISLEQALLMVRDRLSLPEETARKQFVLAVSCDGPIEVILPGPHQS